MRSMSRNACVIHISAVTLVQMTRNAPKVVRKIYRPIDPIRLRVPARDTSPVRAAPHARSRTRQPDLFVYALPDRPTKWPRQGKAFEHAQQIVNSAPFAGGLRYRVVVTESAPGRALHDGP